MLWSKHPQDNGRRSEPRLEPDEPHRSLEGWSERELSILASAAEELSLLPRDADIWSFAAERLEALVPGVVAVVSEVGDGSTTVRAIAGLGPTLRAVIRLVGRDQLG